MVWIYYLYMKDLTEHKNFWLIWLNAASDKKGVSLFNIQKEWGIKTNYLYHNERGLKKPLFKAMIEQNYLTKEGKHVKAMYGWIPDYVIRKHRISIADKWSPNPLIIENWPKVQIFLERNSESLFALENLRLLYGNMKTLKKTGQFIFDDIYMIALIHNIIPFCNKYQADIVIRIMYTILSLTSERGLLNYYHTINDKKLEYPELIMDEDTLDKFLTPLGE